MNSASVYLLYQPTEAWNNALYGVTTRRDYYVHVLAAFAVLYAIMTSHNQSRYFWNDDKTFPQANNPMQVRKSHQT